MEAVALSPIAPHAAASLLASAGLAELDPRGIWRPGDLLGVCERGMCVAATVEGSQGVYVLNVQNNVAWIAAAAGSGAADWSRLGLGAIEAHAAECDAVAFMTARRGLVMKAARQGYAVTGYVLRKELKRWT